jgi:hypothetical protein
MATISSGVPDSDKSSMTKMMNFFNMTEQHSIQKITRL